MKKRSIWPMSFWIVISSLSIPKEPIVKGGYRCKRPVVRKRKDEIWLTNFLPVQRSIGRSSSGMGQGGYRRQAHIC